MASPDNHRTSRRLSRKRFTPATPSKRSRTTTSSFPWRTRVSQLLSNNGGMHTRPVRCELTPTWTADRGPQLTRTRECSKTRNERVNRLTGNDERTPESPVLMATYRAKVSAREHIARTPNTDMQAVTRLTSVRAYVYPV